MSEPEELFALHVRAHKLPSVEREFRFHPVRKWRFDFAWPAQKFAVEIDGGLWVNGRHSRAKGLMADMEKRNAAQELGWMVFHFPPQQVKSGEAIETVARLLDGRK